MDTLEMLVTITQRYDIERATCEVAGKQVYIRLVWKNPRRTLERVYSLEEVQRPEPHIFIMKELVPVLERERLARKDAGDNTRLTCGHTCNVHGVPFGGNVYCYECKPTLIRQVLAMRGTDGIWFEKKD